MEHFDIEDEENPKTIEHFDIEEEENPKTIEHFDIEEEKRIQNKWNISTFRKNR